MCVVCMHGTSKCRKIKRVVVNLQHRLGWWRVRVMWATRTWCPFVSNDPFSFESYPTPFQPKNPCLCASWLLFDSNEKENTRVFVIENFGGLESVWDLAFNVAFIGWWGWFECLHETQHYRVVTSYSTKLSSFLECCHVELQRFEGLQTYFMART